MGAVLWSEVLYAALHSTQPLQPLQGVTWGFMDSGLIREFLGNDCHFVAYVTIFCQFSMQSIKLHAVFLELIILFPSEFSLLIYR